MHPSADGPPRRVPFTPSWPTSQRWDSPAPIPGDLDIRELGFRPLARAAFRHQAPRLIRGHRDGRRGIALGRDRLPPLATLAQQEPVAAGLASDRHLDNRAIRSGDGAIRVRQGAHNVSRHGWHKRRPLIVLGRPVAAKICCV